MKQIERKHRNQTYRQAQQTRGFVRIEFQVKPEIKTRFEVAAAAEAEAAAAQAAAAASAATGATGATDADGGDATPMTAEALDPPPPPVPDETVDEARASEKELSRAAKELIQTALKWEGF